MTSDSHFWEEFQPPFSGRQFKWGLNGETGEFTIWEVSGPGDGFPSHGTYLETAWGRRMRPGDDTVGVIFVDEGTVQIAPLGSRHLPGAALEWARQTFPNHEIHPTRPS